MRLRSPSPDEFRLLDFLVYEMSKFMISKEMLAKMKVADMSDGEMGSLRLFPNGSEDVGAKFGKQASACQFTDEDGIEVIASLNLDQHGNLFELDIWKTNFGKLIRIPEDMDGFRREK